MTSESNEPPVNPELESFRRQWISDLQTKRETSGPSNHAAGSSSASSSSASRSAKKLPNGPPSPTASRRPLTALDDNDDNDASYIQGQSFDAPAEPEGPTLENPTIKPAKKQPVSALDHYEAATEKEAQGNMGDSLKLYRKAYRLDARVDKTYREKHFPASLTKTKPGESESASSGAPSSSTQKPAANKDAQSLTIEELIASFSSLKVEPAPPIIQGDIPPPCPISKIPDELLVHIMTDVAVADVGDFVQLALVCKRFAYLAATEERIWKQVCLGSEFGFSAIHRHWANGIEWEPLEGQEEEAEDGTLVSMRELEERRRVEALSLTKSLTPSVYPTWQDMFRSRPRIRFNGCYISTVNYVRSSQQSTNQSTWGGHPVLISPDHPLPPDVIHHLTPELLLLHRDASHNAHLPSSFMTRAFRGRWRLSSALDHPDEANIKDHETDLFVETEGVSDKYIYRMDLAIRSAGRAVKSNKLVWKAFSNYNKLTDDWGDFHLKNDKPFFFSRVKSYKVGGSK
ncbi:F-box only 9-like protein [Cladobotryum mycophilum]|uniref:F-box only 9-like protein n=1 Tax=Cladobotryum mycophilum TaxID=491253 RepID=A0ABR0SK03_9HYPO